MRIALITPYWGTNLGDAAIQEAVIYNIRKRHPFAEIQLVTLAPEKTSRLHGVPSFSLTALEVRYYSPGILSKKNQSIDSHAQKVEPEKEQNNLLTRLKVVLKKSEKFYLISKGLFKGLLWLASVPGLMWREVSHFIAARRFIKSTDLLLVSGGGQIDDYWGGPWGHPYSLLKWGLIARSVGARYAFLGVGTCTLEFKLSELMIRRALSLAFFRSYRDSKSKKLLKNISFTHQDTVCPDLAFSFEKKRLKIHNRDEQPPGKSVGISPIAYLRQNWPKQDNRVYQNYLEILVDFINMVLRHGYSIDLFTTDSSDLQPVREVFNLLEETNNSQVLNKVRQVRTESLDELYAALSSVDCVLASRLHGVLLSHLALKPVLAISYDRKVDTYMDDMGFSEYCVDIHAINADMLFVKFQKITSEADNIIEEIQKSGMHYADELNQQYDLLFGGGNG